MGADGPTWTVLGAGSALPRSGYGPAGHALRPEPGGPVTLFDCGPGSVRALADAGIGLTEVRRVVVSHFHPDHWLDLFALAFARANPSLGEPPPIELVGPRGLARRLDAGVEAIGEWVRFQRASVVEVEPAEECRALEVSGLALAYVHTRHTKDALAWRADLAGGRSVTYTGDAREVDAIADLARGTALLVAECSFPEDLHVTSHLTPRGAGRLARAAGSGRLLLTHFYPVVDPARAAEEAAEVFGGPVECARDGSVHAV